MPKLDTLAEETRRLAESHDITPLNRNLDQIQAASAKLRNKSAKEGLENKQTKLIKFKNNFPNIEINFNKSNLVLQGWN